MTALVAFGAAILAGLGVGSGGLYLLYLTEALGVSQYAAQGMNLVFFSAATLASSLMNLRRGWLPAARLLPLLLFGTLGTVGGTLLTLVVPGRVARVGFGFLMVGAGVRTLLSRFSGGGAEKSEKKRSGGREIP